MRYFLLVAPLLLTAPLVAQTMTKPGAMNLAAVTGGTYTVDPGHTLVSWHVDHMGFTDYTGIFGSATGTMTIDPKRPNDAKVDIAIPIAKVTTASEGLTHHLLKPAAPGAKPDFFGAAPADAHFVSTKISASGMKARIMGELTLNGVTKPVVLDTRFTGAGKAPPQMGGKENVGFRATTTIKRSDFGVSFGIPVVSDEVLLDITVAFQK